MTKGQMIQAARKKAGLTQKELGEKLGIKYQTVAQWENDLRKPKFETLVKIAEALGEDPYSLVDFDTATQMLEDNINAISAHGGTGKTDIMRELNSFYPIIDPNEVPDLDNQVVKLLESYSQLNDEGQEKLVDYADDLVSSGKYKKHDTDSLVEKEA